MGSRDDISENIKQIKNIVICVTKTRDHPEQTCGEGRDDVAPESNRKDGSICHDARTHMPASPSFGTQGEMNTHNKK